MDARIDVITLAVDDFERALAFYRALGFESKGVVATELTGDDTHPAGAIAQIQLDNGQILALYPRTELAKTQASRPARRRAASSASARSSQPALTSTHSSPEPKRRAHPSASCTTAPGASTPATSATPTDTSGK